MYVCACCDSNCCAKIDHIYDIQTMCLSYPASDQTHYLAFESNSREAQLEVSLTSRAFLEVLNGFFCRPNKGSEVLEGMFAIDDALTIDPPATVQPEPNCKSEVLGIRCKENCLQTLSV